MKVVIVGNGIAGISTAIKLRELDKNVEIVVVSSENQYFFSRPALMYIYMREMTLENTQPYEKHFWRKNKIQLISGFVDIFDFSNNSLLLANKDRIKYDQLVLAVGGKGNMFGWPGQDLEGVQNFTNLQELEKIEQSTKGFDAKNRVAVVGGGLIGIEVTEMMHCRKIPCTFLVREEYYWPIALSKKEAEIVHEQIRDHGIDFRLQTELKSIESTDGKSVSSIVTKNDEKINCDVVVISAGVSPNVSQFKNTLLEIQRGILVDSTLKTNIENVYACGDCAEIRSVDPNGRNTIESLWYTGKMQGNIVAQNILKRNLSYERGIWYNSAKFYETDYHTYGLVNHNLEGEENWFYRKKGTNKSIRLVYLPNENNKVVGYNFLGLRFRHKVCEEWLREGRSLEYVLNNLSEANFDPEFFSEICKEVKNHV